MVHLQERDVQLLSDIYSHAVMLRGQIQTLYFQSVQRANARLLKLTQAGYAARVMLPLPTHIGSLACCQSAYTLGSAGIPVVAAHLGMDTAEIRRQHRHNSSFFMIHSLEIVQFRLAIEQATHTDSTVRLDRFLPERLCQHRYEYRIRSEGRATNEAIWRTEIYKPDAVMVLAYQTSAAGFAIEIDLGHSSAEEILTKLAIHTRYAASGLFMQRYGVRKERTLLITTTAKRRDNLKALLEHEGSNRFWLSTFAEVAVGGVLGAIWHAPFEPTLQYLFPMYSGDCNAEYATHPSRKGDLR